MSCPDYFSPSGGRETCCMGWRLYLSRVYNSFVVVVVVVVVVVLECR